VRVLFADLAMLQGQRKADLTHSSSSLFVWAGVLQVCRRCEFTPRFDVSKLSEGTSSELSQGTFQDLLSAGVWVPIVGLAGYLYIPVIRGAGRSR
jgi:hypothetical protein